LDDDARCHDSTWEVKYNDDVRRHDSIDVVNLQVMIKSLRVFNFNNVLCTIKCFLYESSGVDMHHKSVFIIFNHDIF
jgi:hypothetical protein